MKKLFILIMITLVCTAGFAQRNIIPYVQPLNTINPYGYLFSHSSPTAKTTEIGDTIVLRNIPDSSILVLYPAGIKDSGYVTGTDYAGDQGFAEHYYVNGDDSSLVVIGVFAQFGGTVNDTSTQTVNFGIWDQGVPEVISDTLSYNGLPGDILDTLVVPVTQLGIGSVYDTMKLFLFDYPAHIWGSFFAGYTINYNFAATADTIGLACTIDSPSSSAFDYSVSLNVDTFINIDTLSLSTDTLVDSSYNIIRNVRNATMKSDYNWYDNLTQNDSLRNHLAIYPIVAVLNPTGLKSIISNNLTFFGNYPNPASNYTNVKFSLLKTDDITLQVMDMRGRTINTITQKNLAPGTHLVWVNTSAMPAGDYLYLIRTASGDGMAGRMSVCPQ